MLLITELLHYGCSFRSPQSIFQHRGSPGLPQSSWINPVRFLSHPCATAEASSAFGNNFVTTNTRAQQLDLANAARQVGTPHSHDAPFSPQAFGSSPIKVNMIIRLDKGRTPNEQNNERDSSDFGIAFAFGHALV